VTFLGFFLIVNVGFGSTGTSAAAAAAAGDGAGAVAVEVAAEGVHKCQKRPSIEVKETYNFWHT
jgi:hypothetical protein